MKLTIEIFKDNVAYVGGGWISNGHWAVHKSIVENHRMFKNSDTIYDWSGRTVVVNEDFTAEKMIGILPHPDDELICFERTNWLLSVKTGGVPSRLYLSDKGEALYIKEDYVQMFFPDEGRVYAKDVASPVFRKPEFPLITIMPVHGMDALDVFIEEVIEKKGGFNADSKL